jgi:Family of unknown function (DUF6516)
MVPVVDVYEYFHSRERECRGLGLAPEDSFDAMFAEEEGSDGKRGMVFGRLILSDRAFLQVHEAVVVRGSGIHREEYAYHLIYDGEELLGFDRDPTHDPPEHGHGRAHSQVEAGGVTFKEVAKLAWESIAQEEELRAGSVSSGQGLPPDDEDSDA